jgi:hypothetical protein
MHKIVVLVKRQSGMSIEQFKAYYETNHVRFGPKYPPSYCTRECPCKRNRST